MKRINAAFVILLAALLSCSGVEPEAFDPSKKSGDKTDTITVKKQEKTLQIVWDKSSEIRLCAGGYPRAHRLNDGSIMLIYQNGSNSSFRISRDNAATWSDPTTPWKSFTVTSGTKTANVGIVNPEFAQLSSGNPHHPDRIIMATNLRPADAKSTVHPYSIAISVSDDWGKTWTSITDVYSSDPWTVDTGKGCWEPFVLELPDGTVQIYFSDETPYYRNGNTFQNISLVESKDGGDSWSKQRVAAYTIGFRDGMPSVMIYGDQMYLAIEHNETGHKLHPQIVRCPISENWKTTIFGKNPYRFSPFEVAFPGTLYGGAPYLIHTSNYFVLSYQSSEGSSVATHEHAVMEVVACPISEMKDLTFTTMRGKSRPFAVDQTTDNALWCSMCDLGNDSILALSASKGVRLCIGRIVMK